MVFQNIQEFQGIGTILLAMLFEAKTGISFAHFS